MIIKLHVSCIFKIIVIHFVNWNDAVVVLSLSVLATILSYRNISQYAATRYYQSGRINYFYCWGKFTPSRQFNPFSTEGFGHISPFLQEFARIDSLTSVALFFKMKV